MGKKGGTKHLKRLPAPAHWPIVRKGFQWTIRPAPGPHPIEGSTPIAILLRDELKLVKTRREVRKVIAEGAIKVDGKTCRRDDFPVGVMDVIEVERLDKAFRVLPDRSGRLILKPVSDDEKHFKLCKVMGKTTLKGGATQLNLSGGRNITLNIGSSRGPGGEGYRTSDVVKLRIPDAEILDHIEFAEGVFTLVTGGKNVGRWGRVVEIDRSRGRLPDIVTLEDRRGKRFMTIKNCTFALGVEEPLISMSGAE